MGEGRRAYGEGSGTPRQCSCLENPMGIGAWWAAVRGVAKSRTRLSDFTFTFHFHALEKVMAAHSSVLAWRIPGTGEPGGLPSTGSHRVGHDWSNLAGAAVAEERKWLQCIGIVLNKFWWLLGLSGDNIYSHTEGRTYRLSQLGIGHINVPDNFQLSL